MILNFDESGNLGRSGRYFTIASVGSRESMKPLINVMKKSVLKTKTKFLEYADSKEIKASDSNPIIKDFFLNKIASKDIEIRYIVADKQHVKETLLADENLLYNYMLQFLIRSVTTNNDLQTLNLNLDQRSIKVKSVNSFTDYIKLEINYKDNCDVDIDVKYFESQNSYSIQAADFVANAINTKYEHGYDYYYNLIRDKIVFADHFPRRLFGKLYDEKNFTLV